MLFIGTNSLALLDLKTMATEPIASSEQEIEDPKFSPDGKWIGFSRDANLFVVNVANPGEPKALTTGGSEEVLKGKLTGCIRRNWIAARRIGGRRTLRKSRTTKWTSGR